MEGGGLIEEVWFLWLGLRVYCFHWYFVLSKNSVLFIYISHWDLDDVFKRERNGIRSQWDIFIYIYNFIVSHKKVRVIIIQLRVVKILIKALSEQTTKSFTINFTINKQKGQNQPMIKLILYWADFGLWREPTDSKSINQWMNQSSMCYGIWL